MQAPPGYVIVAACEAALRSPCHKSKRGAAAMIARDGGGNLLAHPIVAARGFNGQPAGFACDGSDQCRAACAQLCMHAEQRAILNALRSWPGHEPNIELVHVKVVDGQVVPGKGPCCEQCSRLVLDVGMRGVWLFELDEPDPAPPGFEPVPRGVWRFYTAEEFHRVTLEAVRHESDNGPLAIVRIRERAAKQENKTLRLLLKSALGIADTFVLAAAGTGPTEEKLDALDKLHNTRAEAQRLGVE